MTSPPARPRQIHRRSPRKPARRGCTRRWINAESVPPARLCGDILRFLMHANCATDESLIPDAVRACYFRQVAVVHKLLDGDEEAVRRWFAVGLLANVTTMLHFGKMFNS